MKRIMGLMSNMGCGGAEIQSILLFNGLCRRGFRIRLLILDTSRVELAEKLDKRIEKVFIKRRAYFDPAAISRVKGEVAGFAPDVLVMVDNYPVLYGLLLRILGVRTRSIAILHNTVPPNFKRELQNRLIYGPSINKLDRVVFVSRKQKEFWVKRYRVNPGKSSVILNGIDIGHFETYLRENSTTACREKLGVPVDKTVIAMNASLWEHKSHDHMIEALRRLKNEGFDLYLIIIGDGPMRRILEEMTAKNGLNENVRFAGFVNDVRPWLMCADISALTSTGVETLSLAAIESMALGKTLILSDTGGSSEIVDNGRNGYLYNPGDIDGLVAAIKKAMKPGVCLSMGKRCREKAARVFSADRMISQYVKLINDPAASG